MKKFFFLSLSAAGLSGCIQEPPPVEHVYHTRTVYVEPVHHERRVAPAVEPERAETFRAVERPSTYSQ